MGTLPPTGRVSSGGGQLLIDGDRQRWLRPQEWVKGTCSFLRAAILPRVTGTRRRSSDGGTITFSGFFFRMAVRLGRAYLVNDGPHDPVSSSNRSITEKSAAVDAGPGSWLRKKTGDRRWASSTGCIVSEIRRLKLALRSSAGRGALGITGILGKNRHDPLYFLRAGKTPR